jgi:hypothetical protein
MWAVALGTNVATRMGRPLGINSPPLPAFFRWFDGDGLHLPGEHHENADELIDDAADDAAK